MKILRSARPAPPAARSIETLEDRIAPAATATLAGGLLTILGSAGDDSVLIDETSVQGSYEISGLTAGVTTFDNVTAIKVDLLGGTDALTFQDTVGAGGLALAKTLTVVSSGALDLDITDGVWIAGLVSVLHSGPGDFTATIKGSDTIFGELKIKDGTGNSTIELEDHVRILKGITFDGGAGGTDVLDIEDTLIGGSVTVTGVGTGTLSLKLNDTAVSGQVKLTTNNATTSFAMSNHATVNGSVDLKITATATTSVNIDDGSIFGNFTVTTGASADTFSIDGLDVHGKTTIKTGANTDFVPISNSLLFKGLDITGGAGNLSVAVGIDATIYGAVKISAPTSLALNATLSTSSLPGPVTITGGPNIDQITLNSLTALGSATVKLGAGDNVFNAVGVVSTGKLSVAAGSGLDALLLLGTVFSAGVDLSLGDGENTLNVTGGGGASLKIATGKGTDTIGLTGYFVSGATTLTTGAGDDTVKVSNSGFGNFTLAAGDGSNQFFVEFDSTLDTTATVFRGALSYTGGKDGDQIVLGADANNPLYFLSTVKLAGGAGINSLNLTAIHGLASITTTGFV